MSEETLFHEALAKPAGERATFLESACAGQPELRAAIEALLAAQEASACLLERPLTEPDPAQPGDTGGYTPNPAAPLGATSDYYPQAEPGLVIAGRYTLQEKIGEGGMGEVWVAKQTEPVKRKVALKLIKTGMDSKAVLARFEQERQALALMDHPNIARVLDGGLTPDGRPFFVMELVNGLPLSKFCDRSRLTPKDRLELFVPICQAVQHAHQKGIIHRDLKPANILVTILDGKPAPKVIDFGVAKATAGKLTDESLPTQFGAVLGTYDYMAPEQAGYCGEDIDTRADIYSLGVILYELLVGLRPLDAKRLRKAELTERIRIIREEEPPKPSTRLSTAAALPELAALRQIEPKKLMALLRGELDWVVMKCLEKQRDRRYETANGLGRDIQRYLADEPVEARPPSVSYRLRKLLRRNKGSVLAASLVLLALVGGVIGTTLGMIHADQARRREAEQRTNAEKARDRTRQALDAMTSSVTGDSLTAQKAIGDEQKKFLSEVLSYYQEFAGEKADDEPSRGRTAAAAYRVGYIEYRLGRKTEAATAFRMARDGYAKLSADFPAVPDYRRYLANSHGSLGLLLADLGQWPEAEQQHRQALAIEEKLSNDFPAVPEHRQELARSHNSLGAMLAGLGRRPEAEQQYRQALSIQQKLADDFPAVPEHRQELARSHNNLGAVLTELGKRPEAEQQYQCALVLQQKLADASAAPQYRLELATSRYNLASLLTELGKRPEAEQQYRQALAIQQKLADDFPAVPQYRLDMARSHNNLGLLLVDLGRRPEAEQQYRQALAIQQKLADDFPAVPQYRFELAASNNNLAFLIYAQGKLPEAEQQLRQALAIQQKLAHDYPAVPHYRRDLASSHSNLGHLLGELGKPPEAEQQHRQALAIRAKLADDFPAVPRHQIDLGLSSCNLGLLIDASGRPSESLVWFDKAIRTLTVVYEQDRQLVSAQQTLRNSHAGRAKAYDQLRKYAEAVKDWDRVIELSTKEEQPSYRAARAISRINAGQAAEAVAEVAELSKTTTWNAGQWYAFACVYAVASAKVADKKKEHAERAMQLLHKAVEAGWKNAVHMSKDADLDSLREREDFKKLIRELEKKPAAGKQKQP
jgi:serine/threonine protein kinase/Flp pilus assembly protein TadD